MPKNDKIISNTAHYADIRCGTCGNVSTVERDCGGAALESWRCQGAVPDQCLNEMCEHEDCLVKCTYCGLPVCEDHRRLDQELGCLPPDERGHRITVESWICDNCRADANRMADDAEVVNAAQAKIIADKILCDCPMIENMAGDDWGYEDPPRLPLCPIHGALLYGGEPEIVREPVEVSEVEGCPF